MFADAVEAVGASWLRRRRRLGVVGAVSPWQLASAVTDGRLLAPGLSSGGDQHELTLGAVRPVGKPRRLVCSLTRCEEDEDVTGTDEEQVRAERARAVGLFRYALIREAADPALSTRQRGRLVRALAQAGASRPVRAAGAGVAGHDRPVDPGLAPRRVRRAWCPTPRRGRPRTPAEVLDLAAALKREVPDRTAAQVAAILRAHAGWAPDERTLQRHFARLELTTRPDGQPPAGVRPVRGRRARTSGGPATRCTARP